MLIKKTIELEDGKYEINAEFSKEEMDSIIEIGLNVLLAHGALPFQPDEDEDDVFVVIPPSQLPN